MEWSNIRQKSTFNDNLHITRFLVGASVDGVYPATSYYVRKIRYADEEISDLFDGLKTIPTIEQAERLAREVASYFVKRKTYYRRMQIIGVINPSSTGYLIAVAVYKYKDLSSTSIEEALDKVRSIPNLQN